MSTLRTLLARLRVPLLFCPPWAASAVSGLQLRRRPTPQPVDGIRAARPHASAAEAPPVVRSGCRRGVRRPCPPPNGHGRGAGPRGDRAGAGRWTGAGESTGVPLPAAPIHGLRPAYHPGWRGYTTWGVLKGVDMHVGTRPAAVPVRTGLPVDGGNAYAAGPLRISVGMLADRSDRMASRRGPRAGSRRSGVDRHA